MTTFEQIISCKIEDTNKIAEEIYKAKNWNLFEQVLTKLKDDEQKLIYARKFLDSVITKFEKLAQDKQVETVKQLCEFIIKSLGRNQFFEVQLYKVRQELSDVYAAQGNSNKAAIVLSDIDYNSQLLNLDQKTIAEKYLYIIGYYFQNDDYGPAEKWLNLLSKMDLTKIKDSKMIQLQYENAHAAAQDYQRKFLPAAAKYYRLSLEKSINDEQAQNLLNSAIKCAILGAAGPTRSRLLNTLYKDERVHVLETFEILQKTYWDRIITKEEKEKFGQTLKDHQKAFVQGDFTVLDKSILEHNIIAASTVYECITIKSLAQILQVQEDRCEEIIQQMIIEQRLNAKLDQFTDSLTFLLDDQIPADFNDRISNYCNRLGTFIESVSKAI